jgi:hypothetical protein
MNKEVSDADHQDQQFLELCRLLNQYEVRYLICGGYAGILHGNLRVTEDVDLLIEESRENYRSLITALSNYGDGSGRELTEDDIINNIIVKVGDVITIDISRRAWNVTYAEAAPNAAKLTINEVEIPYLGLDDLIRSKQTYREKDKLDIQMLLAQSNEPLSSSYKKDRPSLGGCLVGLVMVLFAAVFIYLLI